MAKQRKEADPLDSIESPIAFWREAGEGGLWFEKMKLSIIVFESASSTSIWRRRCDAAIVG